MVYDRERFGVDGSVSVSGEAQANLSITVKKTSSVAQEEESSVPNIFMVYI
jgi:hypothetical protein